MFTTLRRPDRIVMNSSPSIEARDRTVRKEDEREVMIVGKDTVMVRKRYDRARRHIHVVLVPL